MCGQGDFSISTSSIPPGFEDASVMDAVACPIHSRIDIKQAPSPPSPPVTLAAKVMKSERRICFQDALGHGNVFLCLPIRICDKIFSLVLADHPELCNVEVPRLRDFNFHPPLMDVNDAFYARGCHIITREATFTLTSDVAIYNFMVFLDEHDRRGYDHVRSLEFVSLRMFERFVFKSNATELLSRCPNVKRISLVINLNDLVWSYEHGFRELDLDNLIQKYDLTTITQLPKIEALTLSLEPMMALQKKLMALGDEQNAALRSGAKAPGVDSFWGLKDWVEMQGLNHMRFIEVNCPSSRDFFPRYTEVSMA